MNLPLPTGEVDFVSERSELTKSGEGTIFKMLNDTKSNCHPEQLTHTSATDCHAELVSASVRGETLKQVQGDNAFVYGVKGVLKKCAFTLSEVLIVLAVLGVVAAMTIPDLVQDYQKKATATAVKKAYSTLNQVITASAADNGPASDYLSAGQAINANTTKEFFETYWLPYFRVQKVAVDTGTLYGSAHPYVYLSGAQYNEWVATSYTDGRILFSDISGTTYYIHIGTDAQHVHVDINGTEGPNTHGKDVFMFIIDLNDSVVNPYCYNSSRNTLNNNCSSSSYGNCCAAKIKQDGWEIADDYPW